MSMATTVGEGTLPADFAARFPDPPAFVLISFFFPGTSLGKEEFVQRKADALHIGPFFAFEGSLCNRVTHFITHAMPHQSSSRLTVRPSSVSAQSVCCCVCLARFHRAALLVRRRLRLRGPRGADRGHQRHGGRRGAAAGAAGDGRGRRGAAAGRPHGGGRPGGGGLPAAPRLPRPGWPLCSARRRESAV